MRETRGGGVNATFTVGATSEANEDGGAAPGWKIGNKVLRKTRDAAWTPVSNRALRIAIVGYAIRDEPGVVTFDPSIPEVGTPLTASLTDPNGGVVNVSWQWARAPTTTRQFHRHLRRNQRPLHAPGARPGYYLRTTASYVDDHGSDTGCTVEVNGGFYGLIPNHDQADEDWIEVRLAAGVAYDIRVQTHYGSGVAQLCLDLVGIYDSSGLLMEETGISQDYLDGRTSYIPSAGGMHYIEVRGWCNRPGISFVPPEKPGYYKLTVLDLTLRGSVSEGEGEDLPANSSTTSFLGVHQSVRGSIPRNSDDSAWFRVELEARLGYRTPTQGLSNMYLVTENGSKVWGYRDLTLVCSP